jgi:hypothetical protein
MMTSMAWMRPALAYLFDHCKDERLRNAVQDAGVLRQVRIDLTESLSSADRLSIPAGDRGDNLILALIALRLKFPRPEAEQKLEKNLALRAESPS